METNEIDGFAGRDSITTEHQTLNVLRRVIHRSNGDQQCFYCNFSLECGQQRCLWHEDSACSNCLGGLHDSEVLI